MDIGIAQRTDFTSTIQTLKQLMGVYRQECGEYKKQFLSLLDRFAPGASSEDDFDMQIALQGCEGLPKDNLKELTELLYKSHDCYLAYVTLEVAAQKLESIIGK